MERASFMAILSILFVLFLAVLVMGGPTCYKEASVKIDGTGLDGKALYLISIGEFDEEAIARERRGDSGISFEEAFYEAKTEYARLKDLCGREGTFYQEIYEIPPGESLSCEINGTMQERFCIRFSSSIPECDSLSPWKLDWKGELSFLSYYTSYLWDIGKAHQYQRFIPSSCIFSSGSCTLTLDQTDIPPFVIGVEILNSSSGLYFSYPMNISEFDDFFSEELPCDTRIDINLHISEISFSDDSITFGFNRPDEIIEAVRETFWGRVFRSIKAFFGME